VSGGESPEHERSTKMKKVVTRKMVNAIYAASKSYRLDPDYRIFTTLYNEVADHELDEDSEQFKAIRIALDYVFDKSEIGPVYGAPEVEAKLNAAFVA